MSSRSLTRAVCALLVLTAAFAGCKSKKAPPPPPKAAPVVVAGPPGVLVYASQGRIYRMRKGEGPEQVVAGTAWFPSLNADGSLLAYWEDRGATMRLVVMNLVSRAVSVIGEWGSVGALGRNLNLRNAAVWDAKKDRLFFADGRQIWEADADGSNLSTVYEHKTGGCYSPTVAADGLTFAFVSVSEKEQNIWTFSAQTRRAQPLTDYTRKDGSAGAPAWSPTGNRVAYVLYKSDEVNVWVIPAEGGQAMLLTKEGKTNAPAWNAAATVLAVSSGNQNAYAWQIALMNAAEGRFLEQVTNAPAGAFSPCLTGSW